MSPPHTAGPPLLPFKANAARRHHIPKQRHRVTNWAEYDAGLRARGSLTVWFTPERLRPGRLSHALVLSDLAPVGLFGEPAQGW